MRLCCSLDLEERLDDIVRIAPGWELVTSGQTGVVAPAAATSDDDVGLGSGEVGRVALSELHVGSRVAGAEEADLLREKIQRDRLEAFWHDGDWGADGDESTRRIGLLFDDEVQAVGTGVLDHQIEIAEAIVDAVSVTSESGCVRAERDGGDLIAHDCGLWDGWRSNFRRLR